MDWIYSIVNDLKSIFCTVLSPITYQESYQDRWLDKLPDEVLVEIFNKLSLPDLANATLADKRFNEISKYVRITLNVSSRVSESSVLPNKRILRLLATSKFRKLIRKVNIGYLAVRDFSPLLSLLRKCENVREYRFNGITRYQYAQLVCETAMAKVEKTIRSRPIGPSQWQYPTVEYGNWPLPPVRALDYENLPWPLPPNLPVDYENLPWPLPPISSVEYENLPWIVIANPTNQNGNISFALALPIIQREDMAWPLPEMPHLENANMQWIIPPLPYVHRSNRRVARRPSSFGRFCAFADMIVTTTLMVTVTEVAVRTLYNGFHACPFIASLRE